MQIKELQAKQGNVDLEVDVIEKQEPREFEKFGKPGKVCNAKVKDESGSVTMTLWNEDVDNVKIGDKLKITNGWVSEWQGELQLSTGRFGKLEVVSGDGKETKEDSTEVKEESKEEPKESSLDKDVEVEEV